MVHDDVHSPVVWEAFPAPDGELLLDEVLETVLIHVRRLLHRLGEQIFGEDVNLEPTIGKKAPHFHWSAL